MVTKKADIDPSWDRHLDTEFSKPYMEELRGFLSAELKQGKKIFPQSSDIFRALNTTPLPEVKVVILGQDPYHGPGQAHGLSFSVPEGVRVPPSLVNIYKEIERDLGIKQSISGNLQHWAEQGVLLLNSVLTVEAHQAASHRNKGWERFTDRIIEILSEQSENVVFLLWGAYAQKKGTIVDSKKHLVLSAPHPSPLSAHRGFLGCGHFSKTNAYLLSKGRTAIDWNSSEKIHLEKPTHRLEKN